MCTVVDAHIHTGQPVASKAIAEDPGLDCGASTIRSELSLLEEQGLLTHPHTSAGRVPTDAGRRYAVDLMLASGRGIEPGRGLGVSLVRREVDDAIRITTEALSQVSNLLAVVSAPPLDIARIRHVEVLALQPRVIAVVIITSTGEVSKMIVTFEQAVDPGLVSWAGEYLNERLTGVSVGTRMLHKRLLDDGLGEVERQFLMRLAPAFLEDMPGDAEASLYVEGTSQLLSAGRFENIAQINELMNLLERRVALLNVLRAALFAPDVYVRIGEENELPAMRQFSVVAAGYGLAQRKLGAVSLIGPVRMDYAGAIATVREAAHELSRFIEDAYAEP